MMCLAWHLPNSKLLSKIRHDEGNQDPLSENTIATHVSKAHLIAERLLNGIEDSGKNFKKLFADDSEPPLWRIYRAYYDDFYLRYRRANGTYHVDDHTLGRTKEGHLARVFNADGSLNPVPVVQWSAPAFQAIERKFTELLKIKYEDRRGLEY